MSSCLDNSDFIRFHADELDDARVEEVLAHLAECERCAARNAELLSDRSKLEELIRTADTSTPPVLTTTQTLDEDQRKRKGHMPHIPGYRIVRELHRGGQGIVYQAVQEGTHRKVAVKVLLEGPLASKRARRRFEREIELVGQLNHPNIIGIFHSGDTDQGHRFCVMDYIRGLPLNKYVRQGDATLEDVLTMFSKVCGAINYAHQRGVIHRDLKPSNILVDSTGEPKVLDFGLAKTLTTPVDTLVSMTGQVVGTLPYMSPEQAKGNPDELDTRTDIYSLGVILYELLTGHYPYVVVGNMVEVLKNIAETPPTPPSREWDSGSGVTRRSTRRIRSGTCPIDNEVQTIVMKTLAKEPDRRYQTAGDVARDIGHYLNDEPIEAKRDSGWYVLQKSLHRHRSKVVVALAFVVAFTTLGVYFRRANARERAVERAEMLNERGKRHAELGHAGRAIESFRRAADLDPRNYKSSSNAASMLVDEYMTGPYGAGAAQASLLEEADALLDRTIAIKPDRAPPWNVRCVIRYMQGRLDEAETACRTALRYNAEYFHAEENLSKVLAMQGKVENAIAAAGRGVEIASGTDDDRYADGIRLVLGTLQLLLGRDGTAKSLQAARDIDNADENNHLLLARMYLTLSGHIDHKLALEEAKYAYMLRLDVNDPRFDRILALAYLRNEAWADAARHAINAVELGDEPAYGLLIAAIAQAKLGDTEVARDHLAKAHEAWPKAFAALPVRVRTQTGREYLVHARKELLWFDTKAELQALLDEAEGALSTRRGSP